MLAPHLVKIFLLRRNFIAAAIWATQLRVNH
jgi:hypothetical protein